MTVHTVDNRRCINIITAQLFYNDVPRGASRELSNSVAWTCICPAEAVFHKQ